MIIFQAVKMTEFFISPEIYHIKTPYRILVLVHQPAKTLFISQNSSRENSLNNAQPSHPYVIYIVFAGAWRLASLSSHRPGPRRREDRAFPPRPRLPSIGNRIQTPSNSPYLSVRIAEWVGEKTLRLPSSTEDQISKG